MSNYYQQRKRFKITTVGFVLCQPEINRMGKRRDLKGGKIRFELLNMTAECVVDRG